MHSTCLKRRNSNPVAGDRCKHAVELQTFISIASQEPIFLDPPDAWLGAGEVDKLLVVVFHENSVLSMSCIHVCSEWMSTRLSRSLKLKKHKRRFEVLCEIMFWHTKGFGEIRKVAILPMKPVSREVPWLYKCQYGGESKSREYGLRGERAESASVNLVRRIAIKVFQDDR